jgi:hypothetical protein
MQKRKTPNPLIAVTFPYEDMVRILNELLIMTDEARREDIERIKNGF